MKRGLFLLASLVFGSALYSQAEEPLFSREKVLEMFSNYNPSVLEKAGQRQDYRELLDSFVQLFQIPDNLQNRFTVIAAVRNFENSARLHALTADFVQREMWARMAGEQNTAVRARYQQDVQEVMSDIFGVTLQMNYWKLQELKKLLKQTRQAALPQAQKQQQLADLKTAIKQQKAEIASLKKNSGNLVVFFTKQQLKQAQREADNRLMSVQPAALQEQSARQASNLQIKTNHKKPVAK